MKEANSEIARSTAEDARHQGEMERLTVAEATLAAQLDVAKQTATAATTTTPSRIALVLHHQAGDGHGHKPPDTTECR